MSLQTWEPNSDILRISEAANAYLKKQLAKQTDKKIIHLGVKKSGCSGFKFDIEFVAQSNADDLQVEIHGLTLYIAQDALQQVRGIEIDFVKEGLNSSLKFINPNAQNLCGCGESFS